MKYVCSALAYALVALTMLGANVRAAASEDIPSPSSSSATVPLPELAQRREAALARFHDGILLLHSSSGFKRWEDAGFRQDASFYYLTGMTNLQDAILALDGPRHEAILFVGTQPFLWVAQKMFSGLNQFTLSADDSSARLTGVTRVESWSGFSAWLDTRLKDDPQLPLYLDSGGQVGDFAGSGSDPSELLPIANAHLLWYRAVQARWPSASVKAAHPGLNEIRATKSDYWDMAHAFAQGGDHGEGRMILEAINDEDVRMRGEAEEDAAAPAIGRFQIASAETGTKLLEMPDQSINIPFFRKTW